MAEFSYFDYLVNFVPGGIFLMGLSFALGIEIMELLTSNQILGAILFLIVAYFTGHILQFFAEKIIQKLIKVIFWKNRFFSEIVLLKPLKKINNELFENVLVYAQRELKIPDNKLSLLKDENILQNDQKKKEAMEISQLIYRKIDAISSDTEKGKKAQIQNIFYSFFRNFSMCFLALCFFDVGFAVMGLIPFSQGNILFISFSAAVCVIFIFQARDRGELYVKGLFWSLPS